MKKIFLLSSALLFLTLCLFITKWTESTPKQIPHTSTPRSIPSTSVPESIPPADRSIYKDGLAPEYQGVLNKLPYASMYDIKFNIANDLYHITGSETVIYTNAEDI